VRPQHPESFAVAGGWADCIGGCLLTVAAQRGRAGPDVGEGGLDVRIVDARQAVTDRAPEVECREALFRVAAVGRQVLGREGVEQAAAGLGKRPLLDEKVGHRLASSDGPDGEGGDELVRCDHPIL
jgi:hypothetical protein